jgi:TrmH family RNA methyltransferase
MTTFDLDITSQQNLKIKRAISFRNRKERDEEGLFIIEGYRELLRASDAGWNILELFVCPKLFLGCNEPELITGLKSRGTKVYNCEQGVFEKLSYRDRPDGLVAIARQEKRGLVFLEQILATNHSSNPLFIVAEAIEKPGNLGTILRSADAAGVTAVIVCDKCTDIYNPNVVRASVGTLFTVPVIETTSDDALSWLHKNNIAIVAATPAAQSEFTEVNLKAAVAIAVGTEQLGLSDKWLNLASIKVKIPMLGTADSLNVATATTLLAYEAVRQRRIKN